MGRPGLTKNRKFPRLVRALQPVCGAFSEQVARGALELLWDTAYENGNEYLGDAADVEAAARWTGEPGILCAALVGAGGEGEPGFVDELPDRPRHFAVHDLFDHAPSYVKKRMEREAARIQKGQTISAIRRAAATNGSKRKSLAPSQGANGSTPSPSPSPSPKKEQPRALGWPEGLLDELFAALGRKQLPTNDPQWIEFVASSLQYPPEACAAGARKYLAEGHPPGSHSPKYVLEIIARKAKFPNEQKPATAAPGPRPDDGLKATQAMLAKKREAAEQSKREREEARAQGLPSPAAEALAKFTGRKANGAPQA